MAEVDELKQKLAETKTELRRTVLTHPESLNNLSIRDIDKIFDEE